MAKAAKKENTSNNNEEKNSEEIAFAAETSRVLKLMIHSLYTNKDIFLRELISNASDACDKLRYLSLTDSSLMSGDDSELKITITNNEKLNTIEVTDNGIGMNKQDLIENLGTIAYSGTSDFLDKLTGDTKKDSSLIGQFGVGFYSAFIVADRVEVISNKAGEDNPHKWSSDGENNFKVEKISKDDPAYIRRGTRVILYLKDDAKEFSDKFRIRHIVETYSDHIGFPIYQISYEVPLNAKKDEKGETIAEASEPERINDGSALWTRPQSEISKEQYKEFYHHVSHSPDEPYLILHNKVEGVVEYTNLLFVPSMKPFDLFHPERKCRVKLYVKRVFITDENADILPRYLRFVRGIIDSQDLPLNISRETLQDNPILRKIRDSVSARILNELAKKAEKDKKGFTEFWENFGAVLKEGLCEPMSEKERQRLLKVCHFHSSANINSGDELITLEDYISRMKKNQKEIYFLTGDNLDSLKSSPQLEGFISRGIEVLLLSDHVDDFWVNTVRSYDGKYLKSITRSDIDLDEIVDDEEEQEDNTESADKKKKQKSDNQKEDIDNLISLLKSQYDEEEIKDIRTTSKLTETPVCLAISEGDMDMRMERFLMEHNQLPKKAAKILEINPKHKLITILTQMAKKDGLTDELKDAAQMLLDQAKIVEGEPVEDASGFAKRLSYFMQKALD